MLKRNQDLEYSPATPTTPTSQGILLDTKAIVTGVVTTLVLGGIVGAFGFSRLTESNTYRITTNTQAIEKLEENVITKDVYVANQEVINTKLDNLSKNTDAKLDAIMEQLKDAEDALR